MYQRIVYLQSISHHCECINFLLKKVHWTIDKHLVLGSWLGISGGINDINHYLNNALLAQFIVKSNAGSADSCYHRRTTNPGTSDN